MNLHGASTIAGKPVETEGAGLRVRSPLSGGELEGAFYDASLPQAAKALEAAADAWPVYRNLDASVRALFLERIATEIENLGEDLLSRCHQETGLPLARLAGERARTCGQLRLFAETVRKGDWVEARIDTALPTRQPAPRPDIRRMLVSLGPVVVFGSSNFPLAFSVAGGDTASALAAGCPVVVKAHRGHPGTSELVASAIDRAASACGIPAGVFSLVHGRGETVGMALVTHPLAAAVGFTGSGRAGKALFAAATARPKPIPVFAEMSSVNPVFLLQGALASRGDAIAKGLCTSVNLGGGQFCTKPGLVFLPQSPASEAFIGLFSKEMAAAPCPTMLTAGICEEFLQARERIMAVEGVALRQTSNHSPVSERTQTQPSFAVTCAEVFLRCEALGHEAFGPFTLIVLTRNLEEMALCVEKMEGQLTATIHGTAEDLKAASKLVDRLVHLAGRLVVNGFPTGVEVGHAMQHGGPFPATTDSRFTSVGTAAILRFARPVAFQDFPDDALPPELKRSNPRQILRFCDGQSTRQEA